MYITVLLKLAQNVKSCISILHSERRETSTCVRDWNPSKPTLVYPATKAQNDRNQKRNSSLPASTCNLNSITMNIYL